MNRLLFQSSYNDSRSWRNNIIGSWANGRNFVSQRPDNWCAESWSMTHLRMNPYPAPAYSKIFVNEGFGTRLRPGWD